MNFLAALAKFGAKTALAGKVGTDAFGKLLTATLQNLGIETRGIVASPDVFTTLAFVTLDEHGDREFSFARKPGADSQITFDELNLSLVDEAKVFHFGTLSLTDEPAYSATRQVVDYAKEHGKLITYDPNPRKPLWKDLNEDELRPVAAFACASAGLSTTRPGGISSVPSYEEVVERMAGV